MRFQGPMITFQQLYCWILPTKQSNSLKQRSFALTLICKSKNAIRIQLPKTHHYCNSGKAQFEIGTLSCHAVCRFHETTWEHWCSKITDNRIPAFLDPISKSRSSLRVPDNEALQMRLSACQTTVHICTRRDPSGFITRLGSILC